MTEKLSPESTELIVLPIEEQISQELVKGNVTQAIISSLKERLLPLKIAGIEDKETYLQVKEGRKECKSIRVMAVKICKKGRENAVAIQKAWVSKEKEVTDQIAEVEDYLEAQEKEYEAQVAAEKEARKRKQEEQLIIRQQVLTGYGALYSDGMFTLGEVSFDLSLIKESDDDIWNETIWPKFEEEYKKVQAEEIEQNRKKQEAEAEFKRQQEELEQRQKELAEKEAKLKEEEARQALEADKRRSVMIEARTRQITDLGFKYNGSVEYHFREFTILYECVHEYSREEWDKLIVEATEYVNAINAEEAAAQKREQERKELQNKRYAELLPFDRFGEAVAMDRLWDFPEHEYLAVLEGKKAAFQKAEEERAKQIAESAAKKERERIEEEQLRAEVKRKEDLRKSRFAVLNQHELVYFNENGYLENMTEDEWMVVFNKLKSERDELLRKQEEERKAEEMAKASDKTKWEWVITQINNLQIEDMRSGPYRKKAAILREKLEEIKAL